MRAKGVSCGTERSILAPITVHSHGPRFLALLGMTPPAPNTPSASEGDVTATTRPGAAPLAWGPALPRFRQLHREPRGRAGGLPDLVCRSGALGAPRRADR